MPRLKIAKTSEPSFTRREVAKILNVTTMTIANREAKGSYPSARRDLNRYRIYSLHDVMGLQIISYGAIDTRTLAAVLYDKGYTPKEAAQALDSALARRRGA